MRISPGCPPILVRAGRQNLPACEKSNQLALQFVRQLKQNKKPVRVLLGAFWGRQARLALETRRRYYTVWGVAHAKWIRGRR